ncbi:MAG TPA: hypothetical protein VHO95_09705, partial [Candidatus Dormibacteraeota bacterium]|nr:hypothetical protein [Candidatus Dormibacteraeota bacterium]
MTDFFSADSIQNLRDHVLPGLWPFLVAFAVCVAAVPLAIFLSRRFGLIAEPGGRHAHANPTPMLGGLAMYAGFASALLIFSRDYAPAAGVVIVSGLAMALLIVDDRRPIPPLAKLGVQVFLALVAVVLFNVKITFFSVPGGHIVQLG